MVIPGYVLDERLRTHDVTEVWRATRQADGAAVVLKVAPEGTPASARLRREAAALSLVRSTQIVAGAGLVVEGAQVVLVLDFCRGGTLKEALRASGPLPVHALRERARELLVALRDVHAAGIVHRDLKPANIFLTEYGEARLGDFGIALLPGERPKRGVVIGSAAYLSPEQACGDPVDARSDLYSLGLVLHELATTRQVFAAPDFAAKLRRAAVESAPPLATVAPDIPASFSRFVAALTTRDRALRPRSAADALRLLLA